MTSNFLLLSIFAKQGKLKKRGRTSNPSTPTTSIESTSTRSKKRKREDFALNSVRTGHFPKWMINRQLYQNKCSFRSYTFCKKYQIFLSYNDKRNSFTSFHTDAWRAIYGLSFQFENMFVGIESHIWLSFFSRKLSFYRTFFFLKYANTT